ncbi:MAG: nitroreductase family protein [Chloroflexi bacterium]|nr:MAG: nitroreductase family protein [Chloroflexota bacterium]
MEFWEVIEQRRSVRKFTSEDVPSEIVRKILHAAIRAPSAGNLQPWHFIVVRNPKVKRGLVSAAWGQGFIAEAPVVIVVCAEPGRSARRYGSRGSDLYCIQDAAAATEHILLAATALGYGGCWVGAFDEGAAASVLNLPRHLRPVAIIPIGKPASEPGARTGRRPLEEVTSFID